MRCVRCDCLLLSPLLQFARVRMPSRHDSKLRLLLMPLLVASAYDGQPVCTAQAQALLLVRLLQQFVSDLSEDAAHRSERQVGPCHMFAP